MIKPEKFLMYLFYACILWVVVSISCAFFNSVHAGIKGNVKITVSIKKSDTKPDEIKNFGELENNNYVPPGYELGAIGTFETSALTIKCSYDFILRCAEYICRENNYSGFGLINIKKPNIMNSCYQSDIVFFIALE